MKPPGLAHWLIAARAGLVLFMSCSMSLSLSPCDGFFIFLSLIPFTEQSEALVQHTQGLSLPVPQLAGMLLTVTVREVGTKV